MKHAYYNEIDQKTAAWLRELIRRGLIADGEVDTRSIEDVAPTDLKGFAQCHFFAGIGGWPLALRMAGWPDDKPVWTGSCPCQPFSAAGKGAGFADERHLWPAWHWLIEQCRPPKIFGEQVASRAGLGWFDLVSADLEAAGYAVGAADICAAGVGAPHLRNRLWFVADADGGECVRGAGSPQGDNRNRSSSGWPENGCDIATCGPLRGMADANGCRQSGSGEMGRSGDPTPEKARQVNRTINDGFGGQMGVSGRIPTPNPINGFWGNADWLFCRDGKFRPVEPGTFPLAHGIPARVVRLRGYGNAIVPQVAATFIRSTI